MINRKTNVKVIELFGFPGSGKSTISNKLVENLKANNIIVVAPKRTIDKELNSFNRYFIKIIFSLKALLIFNIQLRFLIYKIIKMNNGITLFKQLINVLYTLSFYNQKDLIVLDEGIIQALVSASYCQPDSNVIELLNCLPQLVKEQSIFIYVEIDKDICIQRIQNREDGKSRLDKINDSIKIKEQLEHIDQQFKKIQKNIEYCSIDNSFQLAENEIKILLEFCISKL